MWSSHLYSYRLITVIQLFSIFCIYIHTIALLIYLLHMCFWGIYKPLLCNVNLKYVYVNTHLYSMFKLTKLLHESQLP